MNSENISNKGLKILSQKIGRNTKALKSAAFTFYSCLKITNSGLQYLFRNLSIQKSSLKKLEINLSRSAF